MLVTHVSKLELGEPVPTVLVRCGLVTGVLLTKPCLLIPLNLNGKAEVRQLHSRTLGLAGQQQILGLG